jgi:hypothetical protein
LDAICGHCLGNLSVPGDGWKTQHDCLKWRIVEDAREMGARMGPQVGGLFAACIPQVGRRRFDNLPIRKRQGLVPDFMFYLQWDGIGIELTTLLELKT